MTNRAHARATDPWTSHSAADSIADVTPLQYRLLQCFDVEMAMTDEEPDKGVRPYLGHHLACYRFINTQPPQRVSRHGAIAPNQ